MSKYFLFISLTLFLISNQAISQETKEILPEIVVTATRIEESVEDVTQDITVITRDEIEKKGSDFISEILRTQSDLEIVQSGGTGKNATIFLRGGSPDQVVVMIDGVKVKSPTTGQLDLSGIIVDDIERIEIIKGPQSTLYGSEAMSGVVNIITKRGAGKPEVTLTAEGGSFSTYKTTTSISGGKENWDYRITASYFDTNGISVARNGEEDDGYTNRSISTKFGLTPSDKFSLELNIRYFNDRSELDSFISGLGMVDDLNFIQKGEHYLASARGFIYPLKDYEQILTVSSVVDRLDLEDPDDVFNNSNIDTALETIDWQHNIYIKKHTLTLGAEYRKEEGENTGNFDESIDNKGIYLNGKIKALNEALVINAGLRYDDHETFGSETTYRTGFLYNFKEYGLRIKATHGTGFRAPTLNELFFPNFGNPDLKPETNKGYDVGIEKSLLGDKIKISASYFLQKYKDLIDIDFTTFTPQNIGRAEIKGIEAGFEIKPHSSIMIMTSYTNMDAVDKETGSPLTRRPKDKINSEIEYRKGSVIVSAGHTYVSKRFDSASGRNLDAYSLVNLNAKYRIKKNITLFARLDNLFDEDYEEVGGFGTPGFSAYGGLKASLQ